MRSASQIFEIDAGIVDTISCSIYFDIDDECDPEEEADEVEFASCTDGCCFPDLAPLEIKKREMTIFVLVLDSFPEQSENAPLSGYKVAIKKRPLFNFVVEFSSLGSPFRLASRLAQSTRKLTGKACYSSWNRREVSSSFRARCASNLQVLCDGLKNCWAFSLALDGAAHRIKSYLDVRARF